MSIPGVSTAASKTVEAAKGFKPNAKNLKREFRTISDKLDGRLAQSKGFQQGKANLIKIKEGILTNPQIQKGIQIVSNLLNKASEKLNNILQKRTPTANSKLAHRVATTTVNETT